MTASDREGFNQNWVGWDARAAPIQSLEAGGGGARALPHEPPHSFDVGLPSMDCRPGRSAYLVQRTPFAVFSTALGSSDRGAAEPSEDASAHPSWESARL